ncbi:hypothetical protein DPMN_127096 [Dreissena polymorpha]|uniref:Uncharacterized protein n=1 Tax=Dreissena polymorpha TaxID=45954 RepID=A0A9D4GYK8_DREPO|nr:hypothetical protein DPMN_127096 [Dreissena polymorpha]
MAKISPISIAESSASSSTILRNPRTHIVRMCCTESIRIDYRATMRWVSNSNTNSIWARSLLGLRLK